MMQRFTGIKVYYESYWAGKILFRPLISWVMLNDFRA